MTEMVAAGAAKAQRMSSRREMPCSITSKVSRRSEEFADRPRRDNAECRGHVLRRGRVKELCVVEELEPFESQLQSRLILRAAVGAKFLIAEKSQLLTPNPGWVLRARLPNCAACRRRIGGRIEPIADCLCADRASLGFTPVAFARWPAGADIGDDRSRLKSCMASPTEVRDSVHLPAAYDGVQLADSRC